jgi:crotonobetainyl-CoA:carnitine CoA-transferase CaiB-like acyl-CoA transferase
VPLLQEVFATRKADDWLSALGEAGVPSAPVRRFDEVFASAEGRAAIQDIAGLDLVANPIRLDGERLPGRRRPPRLGEHTDEVLGRPAAD